MDGDQAIFQGDRLVSFHISDLHIAPYPVTGSGQGPSPQAGLPSLPGVDLTVLHPQPPHHNSSLQTQLQPSWVRRRLFLAGDKQKIACLVAE